MLCAKNIVEQQETEYRSYFREEFVRSVTQTNIVNYALRAELLNYST